MNSKFQIGQFGCLDVLKFFVPIYCGYAMAVLVIRHYGPYHPVGQQPTLLYNISGHQPIFYGTIGFVSTDLLMFVLWKCFCWLLCYFDDKPKQKLGS